ncbi:MAG: rhomboid family intramembrane serine protease [Anaerolineae bacterium]|nr:rhomboid family intramembrane serine protease [Anaerolineae bacterium]
MFPIGDDNRGARGLARITLLLVLLNTLVFGYEMVLTQAGLRDFITTYGAIPAELAQHKDLFTVLTAMFVHGGLLHFATNMLFLFIFGDNIERRFGVLLFLLFYVGCGVAATAVHTWTDSTSQIPTVGASGAISGVLGAYIVLYPRNHVRVIVWFWGVRRVPAYIFLGIWFVMQLASGAMALGVETAQSTGVAYWAHIGGFVAGAGTALIFAPFRKEPTPHRAEFALWQDRD